MISKNKIIRNLTKLNRLYLNSTNGLNNEFYSKLAILELCGWIEESMDSIILCSAKRKLHKNSNNQFVREIVKINYGFEYEKNFCKVLKQVIGVIGVEKLESTVDPVVFTQFKSALSSLKSIRDNQAHTHTIGTARSLNAPSWTLHQMVPVYNGLKNINNSLRKIGF